MRGMCLRSKDKRCLMPGVFALVVIAVAKHKLLDIFIIGPRDDHLVIHCVVRLQPTIPCKYNTTLRQNFIVAAVPVFKDQFVMGLWTGVAVGFGCFLGFIAFGLRMAHISIADVLASIVSGA